MTEPTDAELLAEWDRVSHIADAGQRRLACLHAVLAKWGTPPVVAGEPFCYVSVNKQGDITRTMKRKDKWTNIPLYIAPQPTQAVPPAGREPLTEEQIEAAVPEYYVEDVLDFKGGVRFAERHHGIKGKE